MKKIEVNIEISKDSKIKYEYDRKTNKIKVDRILRGDFKYPCNYGYIQEALDWDGDELDVLVYSSESFLPGTSLEARVIGAMKMIDAGETDTKLIAVHADDYRLDHIKSLKDVDQMWLQSVKNFFSTYKNFKGENITIVSSFEDIAWAEKEYLECCELMKKYGKMDKDEFIAKMKKEHPKKYI
ncbi:inorganic diphosphatase [Metamycoplasma hyosynoviae]|uniref:inorganic diphosphatase n=1 Tax=Metamycoplasma hyosynoviae TaxID=29559 RepID=UPI002359A3BA|nr:inorganic diphosphatase [Metamycoplasma hyosynoviae]MDC8921974.1 inorganic diphosphatase [Metamycoplasma hyosynoviae]MDD7883829.1 inorganic diphosphatase [Metamycoplasma hyosynoviae]MDD7912786.1 inorganic diphosphatase [Metamycoplasma hyosynoviae]